MGRLVMTSADLQSFFASTRRDAQGLLPTLVRRLIFSTTTPGTLGPISMPGGDDVRLRGWDGKSDLTVHHPYVPLGRAVWEIGTSADIKAKADQDYRKRSADPAGVDPSESTFVFVTPGVWEGKDAWTTARNSEAVWKHVRVIDGQVLAEWLETAPAVAAWLNRERGVPVDDIDDLATAWRRLVEEPMGRSVGPALVIAGRTQAANTLRDWLLNPQGDMELVAESAEEMVLFVAAVAQECMSGPDPTDPSARLLVARGRSAVQYFGAVQSPLVIVLEDAGLVHEMRSRRTSQVSFVVRAERAAASSRPGSTLVELGPVRRIAVEDALIKHGHEREHADRIARASKGSLDAVLWSLGGGAGGERPWLQEPHASRLIPLVLARCWALDHQPDHDVIARLADRDYRDVRETAMTWRGPGAPLQIAGSRWEWKAWRTAWNRLAPMFTEDALRRFREVALEVLGTRDPALDLPASERWLANMRGKLHPHSSVLRDGLVHSIAMLGSLDGALPGLGGQAIASDLVRRLLDRKDRAASWVSLARWLPELAEAAPDAFLSAAEEMSRDTAAITELFAEGGMHGGSAASIHVLWALERLAWDPARLGRVTVLLGKLDEKDPGGKSSNRPQGSLRTVFLPWHPCTSATVDQRIAAFDELLRRCPEAGWRCGLSLLPRDHDMGSPTSRPEFRAWRVEPKPTVGEYAEFASWLADRLVAAAGTSASRWNDFAGNLPNLFRSIPESAKRAVTSLRTVDRSGWSGEQVGQVAETLRDLLQRHEEFSDAGWAVKGEPLELLQGLAADFTPVRARDRFRWLFEGHVDLPGWTKREWQEEQRQLDLARRDALEAVRAEAGLDGLLAWGRTVEDPIAVIASLATMTLRDEEERWVMEHTLLSSDADDDASLEFRMGFAFVRVREARRGADWGGEWLEALRGQRGNEIASRFAVSLQPARELWARLEELPALARLYWSSVRLQILEIEDTEYVVPRLIAADRRLQAISLTGLLVYADTKESSPDRRRRTLDLCMQAMAEAPVGGPEVEREKGHIHNMAYMIGKMLDYIDEHGEPNDDTHALLTKWEWIWLPLIGHSQRGPRALCTELARSPEFFVEILKLVYRAKGEPSEEPVETAPFELESRRQRTQQGWELLRRWRLVPGTEKVWPHHACEDAPLPVGPHHARPPVDGRVDGARLAAWIRDARRRAAEADRSEMCEQHIGQVFAFSPSDDDGCWPCAPVRNIIEELASSDLEAGMSAAMSNRRGVFSVGDTGAEERRIRDEYQDLARRIEKTSPRTAAVLWKMAANYEEDAQMRDKQGRLREFDEN